mgnify:CR=1 FL=1
MAKPTKYNFVKNGTIRKVLSNEQRTYLEDIISKLKEIGMGSSLIENVLRHGKYSQNQAKWINANKQRIREWAR